MTPPSGVASIRYYERAELWSPTRNESAAERARIDATVAGIPDDVESIADVGCGNGAIANRLGSRCRVMGLDVSQVALRRAAVPCIAASSDFLPFRDRAFDLLLAAEMLEHLPQSVFARTRREIARVARRYVLVTVPNDEHLAGARVQCSYCGCAYHPYRHLRSFSVHSLSELFPGFSLRVARPIGPRMRRPRRLASLARQLVLGLPRTRLASAVCPQCGEDPPGAAAGADGGADEERAARRWARALVAMRGRLWPSSERQAWILALFERREGR